VFMQFEIVFLQPTGTESKVNEKRRKK